MEILFTILFLIFWLGFLFLMGLMWWKIVKKTGYHGALGILFLVPIANIVMMAVLAFKEWPVRKELKSRGGEIKPSASLPTPLIVVIVILTVLPILALFTLAALPNLLRTEITANEAAAKATVRTIATAAEAYSAVNNGQYPLSETDLKKANYIAEYYDKTTKDGYVYSLDLNKDGYEIVAAPQACDATGTKVFIAEKGGNISEKDCE
ncbi:MAG: hypothetical protein WC723_06490 [Candidatus Omnitrophota bacterium]